MRREDKLLILGLSGATVTALCCFTPLLVIVLGTLGLSAWLGWLDYVLLPALGAFVLVALYALYRRLQQPPAVAADSDPCYPTEERP